MSREFERDMEEYLRARKRAGFNIKELLKGLIPKKGPERVEMPEQVEVYSEEKQQPAPKEGVLSKIFKKEKEEPASEELLRAKMQAEDAIADMKETAKIALSAIKQMPDEQLRTFKGSPEFERLKTILKKHELIK